MERLEAILAGRININNLYSAMIKQHCTILQRFRQQINENTVDGCY